MTSAVQLEAFPLDKNERYTPLNLFNKLDEKFRFTIDVAATTRSAKCKRFYTRAEDGLKQSWAGERVWCNPPFDDLQAWVVKAWEQSLIAESITMLAPAWTDRKWWHALVEPFRDDDGPTDLVSFTTRFLPGRIRFGNPDDPNAHEVEQPNFWCCLLLWRKRLL